MNQSTAQNETVVLLVEDDRDDFFLTQDVLQSVPNHKYSVVWAGSMSARTSNFWSAPTTSHLSTIGSASGRVSNSSAKQGTSFPTRP